MFKRLRRRSRSRFGGKRVDAGFVWGAAAFAAVFAVLGVLTVWAAPVSGHDQESCSFVDHPAVPEVTRMKTVSVFNWRTVEVFNYEVVGEFEGEPIRQRVAPFSRQQRVPPYSKQVSEVVTPGKAAWSEEVCTPVVHSHEQPDPGDLTEPPRGPRNGPPEGPAVSCDPPAELVDGECKQPVPAPAPAPDGGDPPVPTPDPEPTPKPDDGDGGVMDDAIRALCSQPLKPPSCRLLTADGDPDGSDSRDEDKKDDRLKEDPDVGHGGQCLGQLTRKPEDPAYRDAWRRNCKPEGSQSGSSGNPSGQSDRSERSGGGQTGRFTGDGPEPKSTVNQVNNPKSTSSSDGGSTPTSQPVIQAVSRSGGTTSTTQPAPTTTTTTTRPAPVCRWVSTSYQEAYTVQVKVMGWEEKQTVKWAYKLVTETKNYPKTDWDTGEKTDRWVTTSLWKWAPDGFKTERFPVWTGEWKDETKHRTVTRQVKVCS